LTNIELERAKFSARVVILRSAVTILSRARTDRRSDGRGKGHLHQSAARVPVLIRMPPHHHGAVAEITPKPVLVAMGPGVRWL
jgi:hypothetical protein